MSGPHPFVFRNKARQSLVYNGRVKENDLLKAVKDRYLRSGDFNGLYLHTDSDPAKIAAAISLVEDNLVQVVTEYDFMNPHILPWQSTRPVTHQIAVLHDLPKANHGLCLYPTPAAMKGVRLPKRFADSPYAQAMARGRGSLELAYFSTDVLEAYRNDPRFDFDYYDFGVDMGIGSEAFLDADEPEHDKINTMNLGFAYDLSGYHKDDPSSPIVRRVAAFYCDLAKLTPEHQQRWRTHQVPDDGLTPHPTWWSAQMGSWPEGRGPFVRLFDELANLSDLWVNVFGEPLFRTTTRPGEFGWLLRPSQREWDEFVQGLDKVLSENLRHEALTAAGVAKVNDADENLGTLARFEVFMTTHSIPGDVAKQVLKPLRDVRSARQRPAHTLRKNLTDKTFIHKQVELLERVNKSLRDIRVWLATHPKNKGHELVHSDESIGDLYRM